MRSAAVAFLLSTAVAAVLTPLVRTFALQRGLLDAAISSRKIHGMPVPRLGGLAIVAAFYAPLAGLLLLRGSTGMSRILGGDLVRVIALLCCGLPIAALGLYDDLRGAGALKKFAVQFGVAFALWHFGFRIEQVATPFGPLVLGALALPITLLWIAFVINAMNLIDGLDGLAGGVALFALGTTAIVAAVRGESVMLLLAGSLMGSVLGFLFYNFNPASIFMGDTGSMFLGYILAAASIQTNQKSSTAVALLVPVVALGLPLADTLFALVRRALRGRPLFSADKEHIHHRLLAIGLSQRQAVLVLYAACALLGGGALLLSFANSVQTAATLSLLAAAGYFAMRRLGILSPAVAARAPAATRRRNREVRGAVRAMAAQLQHALDVGQIWDAVKPLSSAIGAQRLALSVTAAREGGEHVERIFTVEERKAPLQLPVRAAFPLGEDDGTGLLELAWDDGRGEIDRDDEIALEVLCDHISAALARVAPAPVGPGTVIALHKGRRR